MSEASIDAKQIGFSLVALALGAGILFLAGLHLGQDMDILDQSGQSATAQAPAQAGATGQQRQPAQRSEFSFFSDLRAPDKGPQQRAMPVPEGNANSEKKQVARARRELGRKGVKTRTLKRGAARKASSKPVLAPPSLAGRTEKKVEPKQKVEDKKPAEAVGRRLLRRQDVQQKPAAKPAGRGFTVRAGSFSEYSDAFELVQRLRNSGHAAHVILVNNDQGRAYQVRVGRFAKREQARSTLQKVQAEGVSASILNL